MTQVIRIALSLFLAVFVVASLTDTAEAQLFRRLRSNIRSNLAPAQPLGQPRAQPLAQPQPTARQPYQVAPRPQGQYGQPLTPYARTTPQQRQIITPTPATSQTTSAGKPAVAVRVVTYFDPRTGRTYQRRYSVPGNTPANTAQANANANGPAANPNNNAVATKITGNTIQGSVEPLNANTRNRFNIPPIRSTQPQATRVQQSVVQNDILPILSGPATTATSTYRAPPNAGNIILDRQVTPAAASSTQIAQPTLSSSTNSSDDGTAAYSVLEFDDDEPAAASNDFEIEMSAPVETNSAPAIEPTSDPATTDDFDIEIEAPDDVEAFFGPSE